MVRRAGTVSAPTSPNVPEFSAVWPSSISTRMQSNSAAPDPSTEQGGSDGDDGRAIRYLQWDWVPDPTYHTIEVAYAFMLRERDGSIRAVQDQHVEGLFARGEWLWWLHEAGFRPRVLSLMELGVDYQTDVFVAVRP